jgi:hypothetical protein
VEKYKARRKWSNLIHLIIDSLSRRWYFSTSRFIMTILVRSCLQTPLSQFPLLLKLSESEQIELNALKIAKAWRMYFEMKYLKPVLEVSSCTVTWYWITKPKNVMRESTTSLWEILYSKQARMKLCYWKLHRNIVVAIDIWPSKQRINKILFSR